MAVSFANKGAKIALVDVNEDDLKETQSLCEQTGSNAKLYNEAFFVELLRKPKPLVFEHLKAGTDNRTPLLLKNRQLGPRPKPRRLSIYVARLAAVTRSARSHDGVLVGASNRIVPFSSQPIQILARHWKPPTFVHSGWSHEPI